MPESFAALLWITLTFTLAGWAKGVVGMGLPTVAMGLLGLVMVPVEAAALLVIPSLVTNLWQLATGPHFMRLLRRLILMMIGICAGTALSIDVLASDAFALASAALGAVLLHMACLAFSRRASVCLPERKLGYLLLSAWRPGRDGRRLARLGFGARGRSRINWHVSRSSS